MHNSKDRRDPIAITADKIFILWIRYEHNVIWADWWNLYAGRSLRFTLFILFCTLHFLCKTPGILKQFF